MGRTIRRKYVPLETRREYELEYTDAESGRTIFCGYRGLKGKELEERLRWWHADKRFWPKTPPQAYRRKHESRHREAARAEIRRWLRNSEHVVQIPRKASLGFWD